MPPDTPPETDELSPARRWWFVFLWTALWVFIGGASLFVIVRRSATDQQQAAGVSWQPIPAGIADGDGHPTANAEQFVWDDVCFIRPRDNWDATLRIGPAGGGDEVPYHMRHVQHGIVRAEPLPDTLTKPTVLLVGDSHMYGFTDVTLNAAALLENRLRETPDMEAAIVANGSCPYYSLYQELLRARTLWPIFKPDVLVVVIFVGNDLVEMEDVSRPHLDDALAEQPFNPTPPPETTSARRLVYNRCKPRLFGELFWQGMNQAIYLAQHTERDAVLLAKARRTVELMQALAATSSAQLAVALLPSYDDYVDYALPFTGDPTMGPIVAQQSNRRLRLELARLLEELHVQYVDLLPALQAAGDTDIYASDFHLWTPGHRIVAEALEPLVRAAIR